MKREIKTLKSKRFLLVLRRGAILKTLEYNDSLKNLNETDLKPIILALYFNDSTPMSLTAIDAKIYDKGIEQMTSRIVELSEELHLLIQNEQ
ncbi:hypothetical protein KAU33_04405 [Candidatus Dependentiae bacterium]|nr:hypothetical protein [Candidatus Dependentiae bacterium]